MKSWVTALGKHEAIKQVGVDDIALVLQSWEEITKMEWLGKVAVYFWKFQILVFTCSYEIEVNYLLFPTVNIKRWKDFVCIDYCIVNTVEVWSVSKILWYDIENSAVSLIQPALNNCLVFAWHYRDYKDEKLGPSPCKLVGKSRHRKLSQKMLI